MDNNYVKKRYIRLEELVVGNACSAPIVNKYKEILLPAHHRLHPWYLEEWRSENLFTEGEFYDIHALQEENPRNTTTLGYIDPEVRAVLSEYEKSVYKFKEMIEDVNSITPEALNKFVTPWIYIVLNSNDLSILFSASRYLIYNKEDYLYVHCIDTMVWSLCILAAHETTPNYGALLKLGVSALLADIGMFLIPLKYRNSTEKLTDEDKKEIEKHAVLGYHFIIKKLGLTESYAEPAYEHHERPDGSGYPRGLVYDDINPNSIIVSIADVFTSQLRSRVFSEKKEPVEVLKNFINTMMPTFHGHNKEFMNVFVSLITIYPVTSIVKLNTGDVGIISRTRIKHPMTPVILLLFNKELEMYTEKHYIDLLKNKNQNIKITGFYTKEELDSLQEKYLI